MFSVKKSGMPSFGEKPKKFFGFYIALIILVVILIFLAFLLIRQFQEPNEIFSFLSEERTSLSVYLDSPDGKALNFIKNLFVQQGQDAFQVESMLSLVGESDRANIALVDYQDSQQIVVAILSSSQKEAGTGISSLVYQEKVTFYCPTKEILTEINTHLDQLGRNSLKQGIIENRILNKYDFWAEVDSLYVYGKQSESGWQWQMTNQLKFFDVMFFKNNQLTDSSIYSQQQVIAAVPNLDGGLGIQEVIGAHTSTLPDPIEILIVVSDQADNFFSWFADSNDHQGTEIILVLNANQLENVKDFIKQVFRVSSPTTTTATLSDDTAAEYYIARQDLSEPLTAKYQDLTYYYYQLNNKKIIYLPFQDKIYLTGSEKGLEKALAFQRPESSQPEFYFNLTAWPVGGLFGQAAEIKWLDQSNQDQGLVKAQGELRL